MEAWNDDFLEWLMQNAKYICFRTWEFENQTWCTSQLFTIFNEGS